MDHELVVLEAQLAQSARLFEQALKGLPHVALQIILRDVESLEVCRAVDDVDGTLALQVVLRDLQSLERLVLGEGHANAFTTISAEVIIINTQMSQGLIADEQGGDADSTLDAEGVFAHGGLDHTEVELLERRVRDKVVEEELKALAANHVRGQIEVCQPRRTDDILHCVHSVVSDGIVTEVQPVILPQVGV